MSKRDQQILFWTLAITSVAVVMGMVLSKAGSNQTLNAIAGTAIMLYVGIAIVLIVLSDAFVTVLIFIWDGML